MSLNLSRTEFEDAVRAAKNHAEKCRLAVQGRGHVTKGDYIEGIKATLTVDELIEYGMEKDFIRHEVGKVMMTIMKAVRETLSERLEQGKLPDV